MENPDRGGRPQASKSQVDAGAELLVLSFFLSMNFPQMAEPSSPGRSEGSIIPGLLLPSSAEALFRMSKLCGVSIPVLFEQNSSVLPMIPERSRKSADHLEAQTNHCFVKESKSPSLCPQPPGNGTAFSQLIQPVSGRHDTYSENRKIFNR